ncbi:MAG TPA: hypothetical protein VHM19_12025, partial [Polyangiales bacterium]|nr:hypothetical protein [Polyangiales bacterium]
MTRLRARLLVVIACASLVGCAEKAPAPGGLGTKTRQQAEQGALCSEREEGCTCAGNQAPIACRPDDPPDTQLCYEGTRYCRSGVWSGCEAVHGFAKPSRIETTALIDPRASHPQCSECEPECYRVIDTLDPADGPLDAGFATGVEYHSSGAGLTLAAADGGVPSGSLPGNALTLIAAAGLPASTTYSGLYRPDNADVYVLMDQSATMSEETLWLYDAWDATQPGLPLLSSLLPCVAGNQNLLAQGISGAFSCMFTSPQVGTGMFRDIPFDPYATDTTLPALAQAADARREVAFANGQRITSNASLVKSAIAAFGGVESSGDPDTASSQIPALYALATGQGLSMGLGRTSVPNGPACTSSHFGYPCFRDGSDPMIVMITDSPMHNGPSPSTYPYDYDLSKLTTTQGTIPNDVVVPPSNDTVGGAYDLGSNMESVLGTWVGTTAGFGADVPGAVAGCNASDPAADAIFRFAVNAPSGPVPIAFSTEGSSFATTLSVHDGPPLGDEQVASPNDANETFPTALALGDVSTRSIVVSGDTTKPSDAANDMRADYQGSLFGNTCGANSIAPDAAFAFDVNGAGGAVQLAISSDMGSAHPVLSIYDASSNLPAWPLASSPLGASGNDNAHATPFDVPTGSGNEYVSITGDTSVLSADYDPSVLGGAQCNPDASAKDAAFHLHVTGTHT